MAQQRNSPHTTLFLVLLLLGGGPIFFQACIEQNDRKNTATDSTVTSFADSAIPSGGDAAEPRSLVANRRREGIEGIFFSNTYSNTPSVGQNDDRNIDRKLTDLIASAQQTVDCALFELECERIADALIDAHKRGVRVRIAAETDYADNDDLKHVIKAGIPVVLDERSGLMHNKFIVVDGSTVWTGSFNTTNNCAYRNNNNAVLIRSHELAENYEVEFEEMFVRREFGPRSTSNTPHSLVKLRDADIYTYFSPEDDVQSKVIRFLKGAKSSVHFLAFSMTDDLIGDVLIEKKKGGLDIQGVLESRGSGAIHSELERFLKAGIPVLTDGNKYVMHHKVLIIDGVWTVMGSYNFTESAMKSNDENLLIIKSKEVARKFEEEYQRIKKMAQVKT